MKHLLLILFNMIFLAVALKAQDYSIIKYGALKKDTAQLSTSAINKAIDVCFKEGGGSVVIPAGMYKSGTIFLKDNVEINLSPGAILYAGRNYNGFTGNGLIYADSSSNISLSGKGILDGQGEGRTGKERPSNILFKSSHIMLGSVESDERIPVIGGDIDYLSVKDLFWVKIKILYIS